jgi:hypothetical protein
MYRDLYKFLHIIIFSIFAFSLYLTFSNSWIAKIINQLQIQLYDEREFSSAITIFCISFLPLLWAFRLKKILRKKIDEN